MLHLTIKSFIKIMINVALSCLKINLCYPRIKFYRMLIEGYHKMC